jgi:hypothetical protein
MLVENNNTRCFMNSNRSYSKKFGIFLVLLAFIIGLAFSNYIVNVELWAASSLVYSPFALLWAFSFVFTGAIGLGFYRGVFLMSDTVIKPIVVEAPVAAGGAV